MFTSEQVLKLVECGFTKEEILEREKADVVSRETLNNEGGVNETTGTENEVVVNNTDNKAEVDTLKSTVAELQKSISDLTKSMQNKTRQENTMQTVKPEEVIENFLTSIIDEKPRKE